MNNIKLYEKKLDLIIALLKLIARRDIEELSKGQSKILAVPKKYGIYQLCDGSKDLSQIANHLEISHEYARLTVLELEKIGLVLIDKNGKKMYPKKVI